MEHLEGKLKTRSRGYGREAFERELALRLAEGSDLDMTQRTPEIAAEFMSVAVWLIESELLEPDGTPARARTSLHSIYSLWRGWCGDYSGDVQAKAFQSGVDARAHYDAHIAMQEVVL